MRESALTVAEATRENVANAASATVSCEAFTQSAERATRDILTSSIRPGKLRLSSIPMQPRCSPPDPAKTRPAFCPPDSAESPSR